MMRQGKKSTVLQRNSFKLEILGRYLLPTLSFSILLLEIKLLNTHDFEVFAISAATSGWIVWVSDYGLTGYLTILIENGNRFKARVLFRFRMTSLILILLIFALLSLRISFPILVISALTIDILSDGLLNMRMIARSRSNQWVFLGYKKIMQVAVLLFFLASGFELDIYLLALIIFTSNLPLFLSDLGLLANSQPSFSDEIEKRKLFLNWIQNGGTTVASLDIPIIAHFHPDLLIIYTLAKKFTNFLSSGSGAFLRKTLHSKETIQLRHFIVAITCTATTCVLIFPLFGQLLIPNFIYSIHIHIFFGAVVFLTPLGVITFHQNAILLKMGKLKELVISNWISSLVYLLILFLVREESDFYVYLIVAYTINLLIEYVFQKVTMVAFAKNIEGPE